MGQPLVDAVLAEVAAAEAADARRRADPQQALAILGDAQHLIARQALLDAEAVEVIPRPAAHAGAGLEGDRRPRTHPGRPVRVAEHRQHLVTRQAIRRAKGPLRPVRPPLHEALAAADPQTAVDVAIDVEDDTAAGSDRRRQPAVAPGGQPAPRGNPQRIALHLQVAHHVSRKAILADPRAEAVSLAAGQAEGCADPQATVAVDSQRLHRFGGQAVLPVVAAQHRSLQMTETPIGADPQGLAVVGQSQDVAARQTRLDVVGRHRTAVVA